MVVRPSDSAELLTCSFCSRSQKQVDRLIGGTGVYICEGCIELCNDILNETAAEKAESDEDSALPTPQEIYEFLDEYVVGQSSAKRTLAVAVYNHYKRVRKAPQMGKDNDVELQKSNILLLGPSGTGKTLLAQTLARMLDVPFAIADATTLTEAGYVGEDVENILLKLIQAADNDIERAQSGIIYIDEIDKITRKSENPSITRDVSGEGVQQALLKIIEGTSASVAPQGGRKHPQQEVLKIDTSNILFIAGGAFAGLEDIVTSRTGKRGLGFGSQLHEPAEASVALEQVVPEDLHRFGLIPEIVGRLPIIAAVEDLDEDDLVKVLTEPKNAIVKQYTSLFELDEVSLEFTDEALHAIAHASRERKLGARGLRAILESILRDSMFEVPSRDDIAKVIVDKDAVEGISPVTYVEMNPKNRIDRTNSRAAGSVRRAKRTKKSDEKTA